MKKNFSRVWVRWDSNLHCGFGSVKLAIKKTNSNVQHDFALHYRPNLEAQREFI